MNLPLFLDENTCRVVEGTIVVVSFLTLVKPLTPQVILYQTMNCQLSVKLNHKQFLSNFRFKTWAGYQESGSEDINRGTSRLCAWTALFTLIIKTE